MALNIISMWEFSSGSLVDSAPAVNTLTNNGSVSFPTGHIGNGASFPGGTNNTLSIASNASLQTGDIDYYLAFWTNPSDLSGLHCAAAKANGNIEWRFLTSGTTLIWQPFDGGGGNIAGPSVTLSTGVWTLVEAYHSATNNEAGIALNGGAYTTQATSGAAGSNSMRFTIGAQSEAFHWIGLIDQFLFSKGIPTSDERTFLYNGGAGRSYAEIAGSPAVSDYRIIPPTLNFIQPAGQLAIVPATA